jgi:outer membrane protein assembly factor BamB
MMCRGRIVLVSVIMFAVQRAPVLRADNWPQWRGPSGDSTSRETGLPAKWREQSGIAWKVELPEWGTSTPAIFGDSLFLTTETNGALLLLKIDRAGHVVWKRQVGTGRANRKEPGGINRAPKFHNLHNLASPSPVTDGERVIVHFGNGDLASYRFDGREEWRRNLAADYGAYTIWWGHANSPVLFGDAVISVCMQDSLSGVAKDLSPSYLVAHDKRTGKVLWKTMRMTGADAEQGDAYTTPVFATAAGHPEMIVMGGNAVDAYDPHSGKRLWDLPGLVGGRTITGPTAANDLIYVTVGMRGPLEAVRIDGSGQLGPSAVAWKHSDSTPDSCCPVVWNRKVFIVSDSGVATCLDAQTGKRLWRNRLASRNYKASPVAADGHVYFLGHEGRCTVIDAAAEFRVIAENTLDDEFTASPAISDGRIFLRGRKALYAIGK